jgi:hypothetical protein
MTRNPYNSMIEPGAGMIPTPYSSAPADPQPEMERLMRDIVAWWAQGKVAIRTDPAAVAICEYIAGLDSRT